MTRFGPPDQVSSFLCCRQIGFEGTVGSLHTALASLKHPELKESVETEEALCAGLQQVGHPRTGLYGISRESERE